MSARRVLLALTLLLGLLYFGGLSPYGIQPAEEGDVLYQSYATYRGQLPYVDFSTGYTPAYFYWHAALFHLFGVDVLVTRFSLVAANLATIALLFALTARLASPGWGVLAALLFAAALPVFPGDFASFNVAYPAWYSITLWLGSVAAAIAYAERGRVGWLVAASALAGLGFSVKPNVGLFNLVALSLFLLWWHAPGPGDRRPTRVLWWILAIGTLLGVVAVFQTQLLRRTFLLFPLPMLAVGIVLLVRSRLSPGVQGFGRAVAALAGGFALPTLPWIAFFLVKLGVGGFLRDVLLLGSSYERFFLIEHRSLFSPYDLAIAAALAALVVVPIAIRRRWLHPVVPIAFFIAGAVSVAAAIIFLAPMRSGFQASVTMRAQDLSFFLLQVLNWGGAVLVARWTADDVGSSRVDLQACKLEYSIVSPK